MSSFSLNEYDEDDDFFFGDAKNTADGTFILSLLLII